MNDFYQATKISPAITGMLIDWSAGSKEITGTILDLTQKGILDIIGNKIIYNANKPTKPFEKAFLQKIFGNCKDLSFEQIKENAYKKENKNLINIMAKALTEEGILLPNASQIMGQYIHNINPSFQMKGNVKSISITKKQIKIITIILIILSFTPLFIITIPILLFGYTIRKFIQSIANKAPQVLTQKGIETKEMATKLKKYMETYPLFEDRLANELVGHAVAFGMGKTWLKKIGKTDGKFQFFSEIESEVGQYMYNMDELFAEFKE